MPAIVFMTDRRELLGFMLTAATTLDDGTVTDYVLTGIPKDPALLATPLSRLIQEHKNTEFQATIQIQNGVTSLSSDLQDGWNISVRVLPDGSGTVNAENRSGDALSGCCAVAKK